MDTLSGDVLEYLGTFLQTRAVVALSSMCRGHRATLVHTGRRQFRINKARQRKLRNMVDGWPYIQSLIYGGNGSIDNGMLDDIAHLVSLQRLDMSNADFMKNCDLSPVLRNCPLRVLHLSGCKTLPHGTEKALVMGKALEVLDLSRCGIGVEMTVAIARACTRLTTLNLAGSYHSIMCPTIAALGRLPMLTSLNLDRCSVLACVRDISHYTGLVRLDMSRTGITDADVMGLTKCAKLQRIALNYCFYITCAVAHALNEFPLLTHVSFCLCRLVGSEATRVLFSGKLKLISYAPGLRDSSDSIRYIATSSHVHTVTISGGTLPREFGEHLERAGSLRRLIFRTSLVGGDGLATLARIQQLTMLQLVNNTTITDTCMPHICRLRRLTHLSIKDCFFVTIDGIHCLKGHKTLQHLSIDVYDPNGWRSAGMESMVRDLQQRHGVDCSVRFNGELLTLSLDSGQCEKFLANDSWSVDDDEEQSRYCIE